MPKKFWLPMTPYSNVWDNYAAGFQRHDLDASNHRQCFPIICETDEAITDIGLFLDGRFGTVAADWRVSLQHMSANSGTNPGPDGTVLGGGSPAQKIVTAAEWQAMPLDEHSFVTLDNPYVPYIGEVVGVTVEYDSGTVDATNTIGLAWNIRHFNDFNRRYNYMRDTGGGWYKVEGCHPQLLRTATRDYPRSAKDWTDLNCPDSAQYMGANFVYPTGLAPHGYKIHGWRWHYVTIFKDTYTAPIPMEVTISHANYAWDNIVQAFPVHDTPNAIGGGNNGMWECRFDPDTTPTLNEGAAYSINFKKVAVDDPENSRWGICVHDDGTDRQRAIPCNTYAQRSGAGLIQHSPWCDLLIERLAA